MWVECTCLTLLLSLSLSLSHCLSLSYSLGAAEVVRAVTYVQVHAAGKNTRWRSRKNKNTHTHTQRETHLKNKTRKLHCLRAAWTCRHDHTICLGRILLLFFCSSRLLFFPIRLFYRILFTLFLSPLIFLFCFCLLPPPFLALLLPQLLVGVYGMYAPFWFDSLAFV